ncbi:MULTISPECIES: TetR/AcrR family transcriptional regulator [unclassified Amycolatopsis]|uniref:TetR/AcrR family transcriptional regulator n=1 Tax=unclassified Amycolatopsis TaxID=2618356 RepID=UPI001C6A2C2A|nr:TetR/AcrR family transcriptional regulator [Amycolatopsis sp. DSM 110486]QYN21635.1 TetR family transcriptional regulator [Amycolatopsis sp. DSM 110486]
MPENSPRRAPRERQRDPERTKARILEAAKAEFASLGYAAARVGEIATRAGVNKQLISYYFGGKEGLYTELNRPVFDSFTTIAAPDRELADVAAEFVRSGLADADLGRLFLWENLTDGEPDAIGVEAQREFLQRQLDYVRARQEAGDFPADIDPAALMLVLMAAASASLAFPRVARALTGQDPGSAEFADAYAEQLARIVRALKP